MAIKLQLRRGLASLWTSTNPILAQGEKGYETDTGLFKMGDGTTAWNSLAYWADTTAIHDNVSAEISAITEKVTPVNADLVIIEDSAAANVKKRVQLGNLPGSGGTHNILSATHTDSLTASVVLGDLAHGNVTPKWARLAGNTTSTKKFLRQTGTGAVSAVPAWDTIVGSDIPADSINDTHIDWGTGANQVSLDDVPDGTSYEKVAAAELSSGIYKDATTSVKGIASFDSGNFAVTAGAVTIKTGGVGATELAATAVTPGAYTNTDLTVDADGRITLAANGSSGGTHNILSATHTDTLTASVVAGDIMIGNATPKWSRFAKGTANQMLGMDSTAATQEYKSIVGVADETDIAHSANEIRIGLVNPLIVTKGGTGLSATTINQILYSSAANTIAGLATGNSGVLVTGATGIPAIGTDIPTAVTIGTAYIYRASGTDVPLADGGTNASLTASNGGIVYSTASALAILAGTATANQVLLSGLSTTPAWSTAVYPATTTINQLLYSSAANTITGLATGNSSILVTGGTGIPSLATDIPTAVTIGGAYVYRVGGTDVNVANGGTGLSTIAAGSIWAANTLDTITAITSTTGLKVLQISDTTISWVATTGTGSNVFATSPTLVTPNIGVATATSIAIGANTLDTTEWVNLDGINQTLATTSTPQFARLGIGGAAHASNLLQFPSGAIVGVASDLNFDCYNTIGNGTFDIFNSATARTCDVTIDGDLSIGENFDVVGAAGASNFTSDVAIGTQPFACTSTTVNTNLNADLWDGFHAGDLRITGTLAADTTGQGIIVVKTYGETLAFGDPVYFKSDGLIWKADANGSGTYPCVGLCLTAGSTTGNILLRGNVRNDAWAWTIGGVIYLSTSAGLTQTQPTATDDVIQVLGVAHPNADTIYFNPSLDYITHV